MLSDPFAIGYSSATAKNVSGPISPSVVPNGRKKCFWTYFFSRRPSTRKKCCWTYFALGSSSAAVNNVVGPNQRHPAQRRQRPSCFVPHMWPTADQTNALEHFGAPVSAANASINQPRNVQGR